MDGITDTIMPDYDNVFQTHTEEGRSDDHGPQSLQDYHNHPQTFEQTYPAGTDTVPPNQASPYFSSYGLPLPYPGTREVSEEEIEAAIQANPDKVISAYYGPDTSWRYHGDFVWTGEAFVFAPRKPPGATEAPMFQDQVVLSDGDAYPDLWEGELYRVDASIQEEAEDHVTSVLGEDLKAKAQEWNSEVEAMAVDVDEGSPAQFSPLFQKQVPLPFPPSSPPQMLPTPHYRSRFARASSSSSRQTSTPNIVVQDFSDAIDPSLETIFRPAPAQNNPMPVLNSPAQQTRGAYLETADGQFWYSSGAGGSSSSSAAGPAFSSDTYQDSYAGYNPSSPASQSSPFRTSPFRSSSLRDGVTPPTSPGQSNQSQTSYDNNEDDADGNADDDDDDDEFIPGWTHEDIYKFWHWKMKKKRSLAAATEQFPGETEDSLRAVWLLIRDEGKRLWDLEEADRKNRGRKK